MNTSTQTIEISALDTLFFRDGKPFSMGEETWADGIFPPAPSVIYGALRTAWAMQNNISFDRIEQETKEFEILNVFYSIKNNIYFTLPLDLLISKNPNEKEKKKREKNEYTVIKLDNFLKNKHTSSMFPYLITTSLQNEVLETLEQGIIEKNNLIKYSENISSKIGAKKLSELIKTENKVGIARNSNTNSTKKGLLYRVGMKRLSDLKIYVQISGLNFKDDIIKLGGEGKSAKMKIVTDSIITNRLKFQNNIGKTKSFKIVLTSPAYLKNGFLPSWIDKETFEANKNGAKFKLKTAIIGKSIHQGGFDMKRGKPKTMVRMVPAGSIFYFESEEEIDPVKIFDDISLSENYKNYNFNKQGFGNFIIAKI